MNQLKYSIRSLELYAPWIRNIHIVTNGQVCEISRTASQRFLIAPLFTYSSNSKVPDWLDTNHPRIRIVFHNQIFYDVSDLPTFNSCAIEMNLHHILNLRFRCHIESVRGVFKISHFTEMINDIKQKLFIFQRWYFIASSSLSWRFYNFWGKNEIVRYKESYWIHNEKEVSKTVQSFLQGEREKWPLWHKL